MRKYVLLVFVIAHSIVVNAQQWALYNTGTLYDAFENPSQKAFQPDSSRRIASNFLIPSGGVAYAGRGPAEKTIRQLFYLGPLDARGLDNNDHTFNKLFADGNLYLGMLRIFKTIQYNRELGLSWQVRSEGRASVSNQTFTTIYDPTISGKTSFNNSLNNSARGQVYHQLSITYRENYNRKLAFGAKLSYLSGIAYSRFEIDRSKVQINEEMQEFELDLNGYYRTNFIHDNFRKRLLIPFIENPGIAASASFNYRTSKGLYILGSIKDAGIIFWRKTPYLYKINGFTTIDASNQKDIDNQLKQYFEKDLLQDPVTEKFNSLTNARTELLLSKTYGSFQPNLILSKSLINENGNVVLVNSYNYKSFKGSLTTGYDLRKIFELGAQVMYKTPNVEFYLGSDRLFKTFMVGRGIGAMQADMADRFQNDIPKGSGYTGASAYLGFALKFGKILYRRQNSTEIPGIRMPDLKKPKKKQ